MPYITTPLRERPVPLTHSPWLAGVNAYHPSQERFGVEEQQCQNSSTFFENLHHRTGRKTLRPLRNVQLARVLANQRCNEKPSPARPTTFHSLQRRGTVAVFFYLTRGLADEWSSQVRQKRPRRALADYDRAIRLQPDLAEAYFGRGRVLSLQGKSNAAVADFSKALELDPNMTGAAARANLLLTRRNDFAGSIADYDKLINLGVGLDESYYHRGLARRACVTFRARSPITPRSSNSLARYSKLQTRFYKGMAYNAGERAAGLERFRAPLSPISPPPSTSIQETAGTISRGRVPSRERRARARKPIMTRPSKYLRNSRDLLMPAGTAGRRRPAPLRRMIARHLTKWSRRLPPTISTAVPPSCSRRTTTRPSPISRNQSSATRSSVTLTSTVVMPSCSSRILRGQSQIILER